MSFVLSSSSFVLPVLYPGGDIRESKVHLPVPAVKPDLPYVILTKLVIASSPRKMLTLNQVSTSG